MLPNRVSNRTPGAAGARLPPRVNFERACTALLVGAVRYGSPESAVRALYGHDEVTPLVVKAAVSGATTTTDGWAAQLAQQSVADFLTTLGPVSAGSQLLRAGMVLPTEGGDAGFSIPGIVFGASGAAFVGEGAAIPVRQFPASAVTLNPRKIAAICLFSREMVRRSNIEQIVRQVLAESVGATLDYVLLGSAAGTSVVPAGLRNGVSALTAATGGGDAAMMKDLGALVAAVAPIGGSQIAFVASPGEAAKISLRANPAFPYTVYSSGQLEAGSVMAVALPALAVAIDPTPEIEASLSATLHMENDVPTHIGATGSPNVVAAPVVSGFQTDQVSLRIVLGASWALRSSGAVAHVSSVTW